MHHAVNSGGPHPVGFNVLYDLGVPSDRTSGWLPACFTELAACITGPAGNQRNSREAKSQVPLGKGKEILTKVFIFRLFPVIFH